MAAFDKETVESRRSLVMDRAGCPMTNADTTMPHLSNAARKPLGESLTPECFRYEIDEDARLGRHQRPAGVVDRDRSRVGVPLRHQPHERTALQVPQRASLNELVREL